MRLAFYTLSVEQFFNLTADEFYRLPIVATGGFGIFPFIIGPGAIYLHSTHGDSSTAHRNGTTYSDSIAPVVSRRVDVGTVWVPALVGAFVDHSAAGAIYQEE